MQQDRHSMRQFFYDSWHKAQQRKPLSALEAQVVNVINQHPEYHTLFDDPKNLNQDYRTDENPFLHLSLHLGLIEQLSTQRPQGVNAIYKKLCEKYNDDHQAAHTIMDVMAHIMWDAQQANKLPDEQIYINHLKKLA